MCNRGRLKTSGLNVARACMRPHQPNRRMLLASITESGITLRAISGAVKKFCIVLHLLQLLICSTLSGHQWVSLLLAIRLLIVVVQGCRSVLKTTGTSCGRSHCISVLECVKLDEIAQIKSQTVMLPIDWISQHASRRSILNLGYFVTEEMVLSDSSFNFLVYIHHILILIIIQRITDLT